VQIKAFTAWLNGYLNKREMPVADIKHDLADGVRLINFLEMLTNKKVKTRYSLKPKSRIEKIQNLHIGLTFCEKEVDVKLVGIGAEDFIDSNQKMILGFLWTMYKKFRIQTIKQDDKSSEEGLILWVKKTTEGYPGVNINSYKTSFKDGLPFLALCDKYIGDKSQFNYDGLRSDAITNLSTAFESAEAKMGIPRLLDPQEVVSGDVDERSLVLYISLYFHAFVARQQQMGVEEEKARLNEKMKGLEGSLEQRAQLAAELSEENVKLRQELAELKEKDSYLEEKVEVLKQLLEQENEEKEEMEKARQALQKEIDDLKAQLESERKKSSQLNDNKVQLEQQVTGLEGQVTQLKGTIDQKDTDRKKEAEEQTKKNRVEIAGLGVLKKNLEEHIEDLHRWEKFLDLTEGEVDFTGELRPQIVSEVSKESFEEQLNVLAKKLEKENSEILNMLKSKEAEAKAKKANEKKKRERQQKQDS